MNRLVSFIGCLKRILVSLVVLSVVVVSCTHTSTSSGHVLRMLSARPSLASAPRNVQDAQRVRGKRVTFRGIDFHCNNKRASMLQGVDFRVHPNRAITVTNTAKSTGDSLIRLVPHLCSIDTKRVHVSNVPMRSCGLHRLRTHVKVILRGGRLFAKAVTRGLH